MATRLNHPHIVTVHETGEFKDRPYMVSEFIDGGTLKQWAADTKPNWHQTVDLLTGVADALSCAHESGMGGILLFAPNHAKSLRERLLRNST